MKTLFFDLGGVVLSNGWDHGQRQQAAEEFGLDGAALENAHAERAEALETGRLSLDDYLRQVVFNLKRPFSLDEFRNYLFNLSQPNSDVLDWARSQSSNGRQWATLNNESLELNRFRIETFRLDEVFSVFCSSCYLGARKPGREIYRRALGIVQKSAEDCVFVDDRAENLTAPRAMGFQTIQFQSLNQLKMELGAAEAAGSQRR